MVLGWAESSPVETRPQFISGRFWPRFLLGRVWPARTKILQKKLFQKMWFSVILLLYFDQYRFVFLYCKDTNPILKYPVFVKSSKKKMFCFHAHGLVSPIYIYKYYNIIFLHNKGNFQKTIYVLACILALITSLFKPWELGQYFKNSKKSFVFF